MIRLELTCASEDEEVVIGQLRDSGLGLSVVAQPIDLYPASLDGASVQERVTGRMRQLLLRLDVDDDGARDAVLERLGDVHLQQPVGWTATPIGDAGTIG